MSVTWHKHVFESLAGILKSLEQRFHLTSGLLYFRTSEKFQVDQHLIIARAACVDFFAHVAKFTGEIQLYLRMHVLNVRFNHESAFDSRRIHIPKFRQELCQILAWQKAYLSKHLYVGNGPKNIIWRKQ